MRLEKYFYDESRKKIRLYSDEEIEAHIRETRISLLEDCRNARVDCPSDSSFDLFAQDVGDGVRKLKRPPKEAI